MQRGTIYLTYIENVFHHCNKFSKLGVCIATLYTSTSADCMDAIWWPQAVCGKCVLDIFQCMSSILSRDIHDHRVLLNIHLYQQLNLVLLIWLLYTSIMNYYFQIVRRYPTKISSYLLLTYSIHNTHTILFILHFIM